MLHYKPWPILVLEMLGFSLNLLNNYYLLIINQSILTVKPVLSGHPWDPHYCLLNRGVCLVQVHFTENKGRKVGLY